MDYTESVSFFLQVCPLLLFVTNNILSSLTTIYTINLQLHHFYMFLVNSAKIMSKCSCDTGSGMYVCVPVHGAGELDLISLKLQYLLVTKHTIKQLPLMK